MLISEKIEQTCIPLLQHNVKFTSNGKTHRQGKLLLVAHRGHYVGFTVTNQHNIPKLYEIPYPFEYSYNETLDCVIFDYRLKTLCNNNPSTLKMLHEIPVKKPHRLYDSILRIDICD